MEINRLIDAIIGDYTSYGESNHDAEAYKNLDKASDVIYPILENLCANVKDGRSSCASSVVKIGNKSEAILEDIQEMINDTLLNNEK